MDDKQPAEQAETHSGCDGGERGSETPLQNPSLSSSPADRKPSRRHFLRQLAAGGVTLVAAACGRARGTPTASPLATPTNTPIAGSSLLPTPGLISGDQKIYLPFVQNDEVAQVAAVATDRPVAEVDPTHTPTPEPPTATPTPQATPFPPGPPSKIGLHVERNTSQLFELLATQSVSAITTLELDANFAAQIKQTSPGTRLIGRINVPQIELSSVDPIRAASDFVNQLLPYAGDDRRQQWFDGWISYNEPVASNVEEMARLADFEAERTRLLAERGIRSVIGNFGTGQPPLELWEAFLPAIQTAQQYDGWLGLHEYSAPTIYYLSTREDQGRYPGVGPGDTGWLTLRYRQVYNQFLIPRGLAIPLVMTELGVDGLVANRPGPSNARGWKDFQSYWAENGYGLWGPGAYIEQLAWYDEAMRQNDYVIGGCVYALGTSAQWLSYDIQGPAASVLEQYLGVHVPA